MSSVIEAYQSDLGPVFDGTLYNQQFMGWVVYFRCPNWYTDEQVEEQARQEWAAGKARIIGVYSLVMVD